MRLRVRFAATVALSVSVGACAAIWGFQDAIDRQDIDGGSNAGGHDADGRNVDATVGALDSPVETGTVLESDVTDASAATPTEGEAAMPTSADDAESDQGATDSPSGMGATDSPSGIDATDSPSGIDAADSPSGIDVVQCEATCQPAPPMGWEGPFEIAEGDGGPLPGCNGAPWVDKYLLAASPNQGPAACSCNCGPPTNVTCSAPTVTYFKFAMNCPQGACATSPLDSCVATSAAASQCPPAPRGFEVGSSAAVGGACAPDGSTVLPPVVWGANARLCAPAAISTNGCAPASRCLPTPDPQFQNTFCVVARADAGACPSAYPVTHPRSQSGSAFYYARASDERSCTTCTCGPPAGVTCADASVLTYFSSDTCMPRTDGVSLPAPSGCLSNSGVLGMEFAGATPTGGKCTPSGGQPQGGIVPTAPYTICCTQ